MARHGSSYTSDAQLRRVARFAIETSVAGGVL